MCVFLSKVIPLIKSLYFSEKNIFVVIPTWDRMLCLISIFDEVFF